MSTSNTFDISLIVEDVLNSYPNKLIPLNFDGNVLEIGLTALPLILFPADPPKEIDEIVIEPPEKAGPCL